MEIVSNVIFNILDAFIILVMFTFLNQLYAFIRKNILKSIIFILMFTIILTFTDYFIPHGIQPIFNLIFMVLLLSFMTHTSLFASVITNALIFMFLFTIEIAVMLALMLILNMDTESVMNTMPTRIICGITSKGLELFITILIVNTNIKIKRLVEFKKPNSLFQLLVLQTLMIVIIIICLNLVSSYRSNITLYNIFISVMYFLFLVLYIIDFKERGRLQAIQNRFIVQDEYISNMENILNIIRREKHDFSNHLNTILAMCSINKPDTVQKIGNYIRNLSARLINAYHFYNTGNDYVDGMLAVKSNFAFEHDIHFDVDFKSSLKNLDISDCDITSIIGNIIDNAFDAITAAGDSEDRKVSISTCEDGMDYCISISNNGPVIANKDIDRIFNSGYSTKSNEKPDHGFGLYIVRQLVHRYNGIINASSTEERTEFLIRFISEGKVNGKAG